MTNILFLHAGAEMYGADKVMLDLIRLLDKKEFKPYVILPTDGVLVDKLKSENIYVEVLPYPIMRRKFFKPVGIVKFFLDLLKYNKVLLTFAKENKIDIVHTNTAATLEGCYISKKLRIPQLWSIHEIIVKPKLMFWFTSKLISKYGDSVITDSNAVKEHLESSGLFGANSIRVIYNGVDSNRFCPNNDCSYLYDEWNIPKTAKVIGMMGRVNSWKGQHDFLEAANIVMEKRKDVYTVFIGAAFEGEEWREIELKEAIDKSPYKDRIINKGYRTDSEGIYKLFDVFVLPSTNPDPLPTVILEAMATGDPIVGYRHGGVCEMVKENYNGLLAEVRNPHDLAAKISLLLEDEKVKNEMSINSRKRLLEHFSMESYINNYTEEYHKLMKGRTN